MALPFELAVICASNQNRSMAAMKKLMDAGYQSVASYGTGTRVNLPGPSPQQPNIFEFGVPYKTMYETLRASDEALYMRNGVLQMLERNLGCKAAPERWQDEKERRFDIVVTYEERVLDALCEDMEERTGPRSYKALHVLGLDVRDNHVEAERGAADTVALVDAIREAGEDWEERLEAIVEAFNKRTGKDVTHMIVFY